MTEAKVVATVERTDGRVEYRDWTGRNMTINRLKRIIRKRYAEDPTIAHVGLGSGLYVNSYGAH